MNAVKAAIPVYGLKQKSALFSAESTTRNQDVERCMDSGHVPCMMCHDTVVYHLKRAPASCLQSKCENAQGEMAVVSGPFLTAVL